MTAYLNTTLHMYNVEHIEAGISKKKFTCQPMHSSVENELSVNSVFHSTSEVVLHWFTGIVTGAESRESCLQRERFPRGL